MYQTAVLIQEFNSLPLIAAKYSVDGSFLGYEDIDSQLQVPFVNNVKLCPGLPVISRNALKIGHNYYSDCVINLADFFGKNPQMYFYDLCN